MKMTGKKLSAIIAVALCCVLLFPVTIRAEDNQEGYWELVRSFENKYETSASSDSYSDTWGGGGGSYTYRCQTTFDYNYSGSTHDNCRDEFVENKGTASSPKDTYMGGERVEIDLEIGASTSSNICFHLGATLGASISPVNCDDPFVKYGANKSLYDVSEKITTSYIQTGKNDTNTGYWGQSATVGGEMPSGSANGDKVYILIGMGGGNNSVMTAYEYEWVTEGKALVDNTASDEKDSDEQKRQEKEKRILEAWRKQKDNKITRTEETPDPNYVDSGVRFSDLWGQVAIRRKGGFDSDWEYADLNTIIYYGDEIWTEVDSGCVLSFTDMSTFVVCENTVMGLPEGEEDAPTAFEILSGNVWTNMKKMWEGGEFHVELQQVTAGIKGTTFAAEQTGELSTFYLFTSSADVTSKITGETITLKPGEYAEVGNDGVIKVDTFDIPSKAKELSLPTEILKDDGYKAAGYINVLIILSVSSIVVVVAVVIISKKKKAAQHMTEQNMTQGAAVYREYEPESPMPSGKKYFCGNCGSQVKQGAKFCMKCAKKL